MERDPGQYVQAVKAVVCTAYGPPDVVEVRQVRKPNQDAKTSEDSDTDASGRRLGDSQDSASGARAGSRT